MFLQSLNGRIPGCIRYSLALLIAGTLTPALCSAASTRSAEVASAYKAEHVDGFQLASYQDELLECSALAAIHMWIGDNLGDDSGAEVRKKLNDDYWINVSKGYLALAEEADGEVDLSQQQRLGAILARSTEPGLAFGNDADDMRTPGAGLDPRVNIYDMSSDAITYASRQMDIMQTTLNGLPSSG